MQISLHYVGYILHPFHDLNSVSQARVSQYFLHNFALLYVLNIIIIYGHIITYGPNNQMTFKVELLITLLL